MIKQKKDIENTIEKHMGEIENVLNIIFDGMNSNLKASAKLIPILNKLKTKFK
jgi:hypothetical protein